MKYVSSLEDDWKFFFFITHLNDTMNKETEINKQREESESRLCCIIKRNLHLHRSSLI